MFCYPITTVHFSGLQSSLRYTDIIASANNYTDLRFYEIRKQILSHGTHTFFRDKEAIYHTRISLWEISSK